jgi:membrane protein DedA with SNARE-associated domain
MALDVETMRRWVMDFGPLAVGVGSTLDNTGVPIFFVVGLAAAEAAQVRPGAMWVAAFIGSIVGDLGTYCIGRYFLTKDRILEGPIGQRMAPMIHQGERTIGRWGVLSIVLGRFIPYVGKVLPLVAGSYRMSWLSVSASVVVGSLLLTGFFYIFAEAALEIVTGHATTLKAVSLALGAATVGVLWWYNSVLKARGQAGSR